MFAIRVNRSQRDSYIKSIEKEVKKKMTFQMAPAIQKAKNVHRQNCFILLDVVLRPFRPCSVELVVLSCGLLLVAGCGHKRHTSVPRTPVAKRSTPAPAVPLGYTEEGVASWYGVPYHGRPAADGEIYDMETLVAAHRTLPFNTWLRVTNLSNGQSVNLRIIDRGPFVDGRIIDLSKAAARQIGLLGPGVGKVRLEVIAAPADVPSNDFFAVQVGAFSVRANAERVRDDYARRFGTAQIEARQGSVTLYRVLVGKESTFNAAQQLANSIAANDSHVFVVRLDQSPQPSTPVVSDSPSVPVTPAPPASD